MGEMKTTFHALILLPLFLAGCATAPEPAKPVAAAEPAALPKKPLDERIAYYADHYDVPESLIRRSIEIESGYNPKARNGPYWGLMQIRLDTARALGYHGPAKGLLDADANLKYATAYLSNAYLVAEGDEKRALRLYANGYFYEARRKGLLDQLKTAREETEVQSADSSAPPPEPQP